MNNTKTSSKYLKLLRNKRYVMYIVGQILSLFSDGLFRIMIIWSALETANSVKPIAALLLISYIPQVLVGLFGGYFVDKYKRKYIMVFSDVVSGLAVLILLCFYLKNSGFQLYMIFAIRFILSLMDVFYSPAAMAFIPEIIERDELLNANLLYSIISQVAEVVSFGLSGIIIAKIGTTNVLLLNSIAYFLAALSVLIIPVIAKVEKKENLVFDFKHLSAGFKQIFKDAYLIQFVTLVFLINIFYYIVYNLPSIYVRNILKTGAQGFGFIQTALTLGMLLGTGLVSILNIKKSGLLFIFSLFSGGLFLYALGVNTGLSFGILLYLLFSLTDAFSIPSFTYLQLHVEDQMKGRVFAAFDTIVLFAAPIAALLLNLFADSLGVAVMYKLSGLSFLIIGLLALRFKAFKESDLRTLEKQKGL